MIVPGRGHTRDNQISLLQCILESCAPPEHLKVDCDTDNCKRCVYDLYTKELEADYKPRSADTKSFPMLDGVRKIPWALGYAIWETLYEPVYHDQTAARLAERGGVGWEEVQLMAREAAKKGLF